ncbi:hypothetical protein DN757_24835 [Paenibacillus silvae]|uniref:Uncharacterized protein n=1 Tax=Paenibacillus silvae TaxID=1325358 RepID=A0A2W6NBE8_9BACL|nr:hypothetical protein DN757_24835 [Paenibacillus silvae]
MVWILRYTPAILDSKKLSFICVVLQIKRVFLLQEQTQLPTKPIVLEPTVCTVRTSDQKAQVQDVQQPRCRSGGRLSENNEAYVPTYSYFKGTNAADNPKFILQLNLETLSA